ncbi:hypothetical protein [Desulfofalx alkaliphila]|uniref:hypothetical protein n=1 Tax=Desulfofalx alkaliphila TaxID=105483 RepID=UPI0004E22E51|nr:hypothetical protein [Desulfofalx alkaliphila]
MHYYTTEQQAQLQPNAYTLFLILILLMLGTNRDFESRLHYVTNLLSGSLNAVKMMRAGINEFHTAMKLNEGIDQ